MCSTVYSVLYIYIITLYIYSTIHIPQLLPYSILYLPPLLLQYMFHTNIDSPSREDLLSALELISDYLTLSSATKLATVFEFTSTELQNCSVNTTSSSSSSSSGSNKRKTDWEQELEVNKPIFTIWV